MQTRGEGGHAKRDRCQPRHKTMSRPPAKCQPRRQPRPRAYKIKLQSGARREKPQMDVPINQPRQHSSKPFRPPRLHGKRPPPPPPPVPPPVQQGTLLPDGYVVIQPRQVKQGEWGCRPHATPLTSCSCGQSTVTGTTPHHKGSATSHIQEAEVRPQTPFEHWYTPNPLLNLMSPLPRLHGCMRHGAQTAKTNRQLALGGLDAP